MDFAIAQSCQQLRWRHMAKYPFSHDTGHITFNGVKFHFIVYVHTLKGKTSHIHIDSRYLPLKIKQLVFSSRGVVFVSSKYMFKSSDCLQVDLRVYDNCVWIFK